MNDEMMDIDSEEIINDIAREVLLTRESLCVPQVSNSERIANYNSTQLPSILSSASRADKCYSKQMIYLVVDTNFIISHLQIIDNLVNLWEYYHHLYQIIIPRQVIHELDGLKDSNDAPDSRHSLSQMSRRAIDWCYTHFHNVSPQVRGQKLIERIDELASKDNSILDCCLYFQYKEQGGGSMVVLLSNDKNLCNKALVNNILTVSFRNEMNANLIAERTIIELMSGLNGNSPQGHVMGNLLEVQSLPLQQQEPDVMMIEEDDNINQPHEHQNDTINDKDGDSKLDFDTSSREIYDQTELLVREALTFAVHVIFGDQFELCGYKPENIKGLIDACYCIQKMYISTFSEFFTRKSFNPSKLLQEKYQIRLMGSVPKTLTDLNKFESFWKQFLEGIYKERDMEQRASLKQIINHWDDLIRKL